MMKSIEDQEQTDSVIETRTPSMSIEVKHDANHIESWLYDHVMRERMSFVQTVKWQTEKRVADLPHESLLATAITSWADQAVLCVREMLVHIIVRSNDSCIAYVYASRYAPGDVEAVAAQLKGWLEPKAERTPDRVLVGFRYMADGEPRYRTRSIEAPAWERIRGNYAASVQKAIDGLASGFAPGGAGRLILLHGAPGTGKTYVIRALARSWREWCTFEYIADPEKFVGDAGYMMEVLLDHDDDDEDDDESTRWRLLVIEDAGELLARDARSHEGQGLSRLLNMSEGLIGQGLRVMTLISTNDPLDSLNEAVARPGRTAAEVEFSELSVAEANAWLAANDSEGRAASESMTLAELYALINGESRAAKKPRRPIGFGRN